MQALMNEIKDVPLTRGVPYRGCLRIEVPQISQKDVDAGSVTVAIGLVGALQRKHRLRYRQGDDKIGTSSSIFCTDGFGYLGPRC